MKIIKRLKETDEATGDVKLVYTVEDGTSLTASIRGHVVQDMSAIHDLDAVAELELVLETECLNKE